MWKWMFPWTKQAEDITNREIDAKVSKCIDTLLEVLECRNEAAEAWNQSRLNEQTIRDIIKLKNRLEEEKIRLAKEIEEERIQLIKQAEDEKIARSVRISNGSMRCAICISGFMRLAGSQTCKDLQKHMQKSFYDLNCDIFISTWNIAGIQKGKNQTFAWRWPEVYINQAKIEKLYGERLKGCHILPYDSKKVTPDWLLKHAPSDMHLSQRLSSMYYHVYEANKLKNEYENQNNFKYDVVIRCRSDLNFHQGKASDVIKTVNYQENRVFVPHCESYGYINDQFMFGYSNVMNKVADLYNHLLEKSPMIKKQPENNPMHPAELFFQTYLNRQNIEIVKCDISYTRSS